MRWVLLVIWASKYGTMRDDIYSLNVFAVAGRTMWITAAISNTTCLAAAARPVGELRHLRKSDPLICQLSLIFELKEVCHVGIWTFLE